jgi:hypothetical protein
MLQHLHLALFSDGECCDAVPRAACQATSTCILGPRTARGAAPSPLGHHCPRALPSPGEIPPPPPAARPQSSHRPRHPAAPNTLPPPWACSRAGPKRLLSQELVACWADEYAAALALLRRALPAGLVRFLNAPKAPAAAAAAAPAAAAAQALPSAGAAGAMQSPAQQVLPSPVKADPLTGAAAVASDPLAAGPRPEAGAAGDFVSRGNSIPVAPAYSGNGVPPASGAAAAGLAAAVQPPAAVSPPPPPGGGQAPQLSAQAAGVFKGNWAAFWDAAGRDHCHAGGCDHQACLFLWGQTSPFLSAPGATAASWARPGHVMAPFGRLPPNPLSLPPPPFPRRRFDLERGHPPGAARCSGK